MNDRGDKRPIGNDSISTSSGGTPRKQRRGYSPERSGAETYIETAKSIMEGVENKLSRYVRRDKPAQNLVQFVRGKITKLDTSEKRKTTVGVFGRTGSGKSSLINAILGEYLLPSGTFYACTSVIIQIEANQSDSNYTAEIEFITEDDWENELKTLLDILNEDPEERDNALFKTAKEKLTALYGKEGISMTKDKLMTDDKFSGISESLKNKTKTITKEKSLDLSKEIRCYIQDIKSSPGGCYWPVVKSVTIKVPRCNDFLEHVILVDLPGTGDYNKSRDQMWRSKLSECSALWIVSEINRAGSDKETWDLVSNSIAYMAEGGECRSISFICTKTDYIDPEDYMRSSTQTDEELQITPKDSQNIKKKKCILHRNNQAKKLATEEFFDQDTVKKHFSCKEDFFSVYTVSSKKITNDDQILSPEETEIPKLRNKLRMYNNIHTSHYISGAIGILSLIQGFKENNAEMMDERRRLHNDLKKDLDTEVKLLRKYCGQICSSLEKLLSVGVRESEEKCNETASKEIKPDKDSRGFHQTLTALCKNDGYYRSKNGDVTDLNTSLAKHMLDHIDKEFSDFFPVQGPVTEKSLQAHIEKFTIIKEDLIKKYKNSPVLSHMLEFLKMEEMRVKTRCEQEVVAEKKTFYSSLSESITTTMQPAYESAAKFSGTGSMVKKQDELLEHIQLLKSEMFKKAKTKMLNRMKSSMKDSTVDLIESELKESMEYSLLDPNTMPNMNVSSEKDHLKRLQAEIGSDQ